MAMVDINLDVWRKWLALDFVKPDPPPRYDDVFWEGVTWFIDSIDKEEE